MSTKEEKPTLAGVNVKTRKRNIVIPQDPGSFADAVVQLVEDARERVSLEGDLETAANALDKADLEFARYGESLFEVFFAGGRLQSGAVLVEEGKKLPDLNVLACKPEREAILPFVKLFVGLTRRRPFLIRSLENTLIKLELSLEFLEEANRKKLAIALALVYTLKLGVVPENIFAALLNDRLVSKGNVVDFITIVFQEIMATDSMDDLVSLLTRAKVANRLMDFFPPSKRTMADVNAHLKANGLENLAEWNEKREMEAKVTELQDALSNLVVGEGTATEVLALAQGKKTENSLPDADVLRVVWNSLVKSINMTGKNQQQIMQALVQKIKTYRKVLSAFATSGKVELSLIVHMQIQYYEDNRLLKLFSDTLRVLYDAEVIAEDTILHWHKKGSHAKGRNVFIKDTEAFIKWLEEAEEEDEDDA